jgi:choline dehydrogenase-like flavoprotein
MSEENYIPNDPEEQLWDVIVVGTGMGGSTVGYELSRLGNRVLFLEKGKFVQGNHISNFPNDTSEHEVRLIKGRWPHKLEGTTSFGPAKFFGPVGCGTGGSTILYGAQLERFHPSDFTPRQHFKDVGESTVPEKWPISYEDLIPYYREAERHMKICGTQDELNPDPEAPLEKAPPLSERDQFIFSRMKKVGLHPYRSHVGYHNIDQCWECLDLCFRGCKSDAGTRSLLPAIHGLDANLLTECEAVRLEADDKEVKYVEAKRNGETLKLKAKMVVLAAGAYVTPTLLLRSSSDFWKNGLANGSGLVGRNLMLHTSDFIMIDQDEERDSKGPIKSITVNDFYISDGEKLGTFQSVGLQPIAPIIRSYLEYVEEKDPHWLGRKSGSSLAKLAELASERFKKSSAFTTILEDLPYYHNRIELDDTKPSGFQLHYDYPAELRERNKKLLDLIAKSLAPELKTKVVTATENNINFGHVCGTCRFGDDPKTSVLNAENRAHEVENLYVVDASFFPSSSGINPSLTIAANALRVGKIIHKRLEAMIKTERYA